MTKSILYDFTPFELQKLLNESNGYSDLLRKIGLCSKGGNPQTLKKIINEWQLDESQLDINRSKLYQRCQEKSIQKQRRSLEDVLCNKVPFEHSAFLLKRLVTEGYKEYRCEECGISEWQNKPISLQLHHKDGNHKNNKLDNLQVLCPNCHTQTDNYGAKVSNETKEKRLEVKRKIKELKKQSYVLKPPPIEREELKMKIRKTPFVQIAKEYGVTDNTIRKWCDKYQLPRKVSVI